MHVYGTELRVALRVALRRKSVLRLGTVGEGALQLGCGVMAGCGRER